MDQIAIEFRPTPYTNDLIPYRVPDPRSLQAPHINYRRVRIIEEGVKRLSNNNLPGTHHAERYLPHKYRLNLQAGTLKGTVSFLLSFLTFLKGQGIPTWGRSPERIWRPLSSLQGDSHILLEAFNFSSHLLLKELYPILLLACFNFLWHTLTFSYGDMDSAADCASEAYGYARKAYYSNTLVEAQY